jgi:uncharacterized OsmC-like protein
MTSVNVESLQKYRILVAADDHALVADEPKGIGDGLGPDPYELLLAALGSCTTMTLLMYARRKGWALRRVTAELQIERLHAEDCRECERSDGSIEQITLRLHLDGDLDPQQRERLADIAKRCPVRKTLMGGPRIQDIVE